MKICDLTQAYTPQSGGIRTFIHEKLKYIAENTRDEHILIIPGETDSVVRDGQFTTYTIKAPHIPNCEPYRFTFRLDKVYHILKKERPDVIELGSPYVMPYPALLYKMRYGCSTIGFYHTDFPTAYSEQAILHLAGKGWSKVAKRLSEWYARQVYNRCDYTVTASAMLQKKLKKMGIKRTVRVPLGVDLDLFNPEKRDVNIRQKLGIDDEKIIFVYSGRLDSEKRINIILEAFNNSFQSFDGALLIVGQGPLENLVQEYAEQNQAIYFLPYLNDKKALAGILASSDIYVTAGPHETFGLSIIEAQASGLAVLGVNAGALRERVNPQTGVLVQPDNVDVMARKMFDLATNGYKEKGKRARILVENEYSWTKTFTYLYRLYEISVNKN